MTKRAIAGGLAVLSALIISSERGTAQQTQTTLRVRATGGVDLRIWDTFLTQTIRSGDLRVRRVDRDPSTPSQVIERYDQYFRGVRIWGGDVVRDSDNGVTQWIFGSLSPELSLSVEPGLSIETARDRLRGVGGASGLLLRDAELVVVTLPNAEPRLAYTAVVSGDNKVLRVFVDAHSGVELLRYSSIQTQAAIGTGKGVFGDTKKMSVLRQGGVYVADDQQRPPVLTTFDMRGNILRAFGIVEAGDSLFASDVATDSDNNWTDVAAVDAHAYIGWTYDYYFKRHGRRGLDDRDRPIVSLINGATQQGALSVPAELVPQFVLNAFWCGACGPSGVGVMYFGNGIPAEYGVDSYVGYQNWTYLAGSLDVVAHELTHGVTESSSGLIYLNESGALNEAFSDIMGTSVEFHYQPVGAFRGEADYLIGEDSIRGLVNGLRSMNNPAAFGDPDHYSLRYTGTADNGGVHINSGIPNQAFFLAIEGGTNRTSGLAVQGVGSANREQIERVFYRAFVYMLPAWADFSTARVATIQAARDLYGMNSAAERAVTQAWTAVGVF